MDKQLFIPDKIRVGFQERRGTYTGKLAYVIYYDKKGTLRKEKSWQGWRDHKIPDIAYENVPTTGFVLNKGVGGARHSYGWNPRNEYIRVYDPRDFEFEISVANLLFILRECDCSRGKGLEGEFVYSWDGPELVLLPSGSLEYKQSKSYTELQASKVSAKDLIPGATYITRKQKELVYLGRFEVHFIYCPDAYSNNKKKHQKGFIKQHVFWDEKEQDYVFLNSMTSLATCGCETAVHNYAELVDAYNKSIHGSKVVGLSMGPMSIPKDPDVWHYSRPSWFYQDEDDAYVECQTDYGYGRTQNKIISITTQNKYVLENGRVVCRRYHRRTYREGEEPRRRYSYEPKENLTNGWRNPTNHRLFATTESGSKFRISTGKLREIKDGKKD